MNSNEIQQTSRSLSGRVAVLTGATSGIGAATARRLVAEGARVAVLGRREDRLAELDALAVPVDITDHGALAGAAERIRAELGRVDLVVANAGAMLGAPFESADTVEWDRMLDVNLRGLLHTGRAFADDLLSAAEAGDRADLVHVGSVGGHQLYPNFGVYCATKAAVAHLTRNLRAELGGRNVRVKNVEPGVTVTELGDDMVDGRTRQVVAAMRAELTPLQAEDIADAIAYAVAAPPRVNLAELVVVPTRQG
ncbi:SDR family oxidoreductase [Amycolatopsis nigrescens]|uniref:SDR family oxidoreductase n=1 Tax=Amycolatopsis nigrescens TaxID=381445 RepID=UPI00036FFBBA|nr:SDR family oxidoreductase [Amycolatopsis nigrescens]